MVEWIFRTADRFDPAGLPRPCCRVRRATPSSRASLIRELLQSGSNPSVAEQGCTGITRRPDPRVHSIEAISWRASSPICPDLIFDRDKGEKAESSFSAGGFFLLSRQLLSPPRFASPTGGFVALWSKAEHAVQPSQWRRGVRYRRATRRTPLSSGAQRSSWSPAGFARCLGSRLPSLRSNKHQVRAFASIECKHTLQLVRVEGTSLRARRIARKAPQNLGRQEEPAGGNAGPQPAHAANIGRSAAMSSFMRISSASPRR